MHTCTGEKNIKNNIVQFSCKIARAQLLLRVGVRVGVDVDAVTKTFGKNACSYFAHFNRATNACDRFDKCHNVLSVGSRLFSIRF